MKIANILIADDHTLVRETWSFMFKTDSRFNVIGVVGSGEEAVEIAKVHTPDIVLMDINLPGINGVQATELLLRVSPSSKVLAISMHSEPSYARAMMQKGAMGYVTKNSGTEEMFTAIFSILEGKKYICKEVKENVTLQEITNDEPDITKAITEREYQIAKMVVQGMTSKEIADDLKVSVNTIEVHRHKTLKKLGLKNTPGLIQYMNRQLKNNE